MKTVTNLITDLLADNDYKMSGTISIQNQLTTSMNAVINFIIFWGYSYAAIMKSSQQGDSLM